METKEVRTLKARMKKLEEQLEELRGKVDRNDQRPVLIPYPVYPRPWYPYQPYWYWGDQTTTGSYNVSYLSDNTGGHQSQTGLDLGGDKG